MTEQPPQRLRPAHRFSARTRLAFSYAVLVIICGAVLLTVLVTYLGLGPDYSFGRVGATGEDGSVLIVPDSTHPPAGTEGSEVADGAEGPGGSFSVEVQSREDLITLLITVSVIVLLILAVLSSLVAWWLAGRMLRPLAQINEAAQIAASGRLDHRIGLRGPRDEIVDLAQTFDAMLENIQRYNTAQRRFAANASHELRTPLAASKTILDVARATPGAVDRQVLERLAELNARSSSTVESLLDLAEAEAGGIQTGPVDLAEVAETVLDQYTVAADERGLQVTTELGPAVADADERLLVQLMQNLVENAIRHNRDNGVLTVRTATLAPAKPPVATDETGDVQLRVEGAGEMIAPEVLAHLTEPFHTARGRAGGASRGLGLAIVAAIVERSHGELELTARPGGGLIVTVTLPRASAGQTT
ncbi:sensor histidine kinase [Auritidibacter ignavus]|uniref:sensor histidine kinase n=1 Tax=Auritidibacter ignavus TaxID=678932 RepID=UPI00141BD868|nr:HAMP domain-containing sensor histidine kinase [Auritidibacter ignavus]NIH72609.1 two-component system sensor histidine kinase VanS [Auritidibacter ignavus]